MSTIAMRTCASVEYYAEAERRFGSDVMGWKFKCPVCGHVASVADYKNAGAPDGAVGFSCIGRYVGAKREAFGGTGPGPCNYAGGGLFKLNPVLLDGKTAVFELADADAARHVEGASRKG